MRGLKRLAVTALILAGATPVTAQSPVWVDYQSGSGVNYNGWQVGTYKAAVGGSQVAIWCTDFYNHAKDMWAYKSNLGGTNPDLSRTRFGGLSNQPERYRQAAYLTSLFKSDNKSEWGFIHYAIWQLMSPSTPAKPAAPSLTAQNKVNGYLGMAAANFGKYYYDKFYVLTDKVVTDGNSTWRNGCQGITGEKSCGGQEFLYGELTPVPEPATVALMGTGLLGVALVGLRRRRKS